MFTKALAVVFTLVVLIALFTYVPQLRRIADTCKYGATQTSHSQSYSTVSNNQGPVIGCVNALVK